MVEKRFEKLGMPDIERFENYLPTAFNSELTLLQKVNKIIFDLIETNKLTNEMVDYLNKFIEKFDEKLYKTVEDVLKVWLDDGLLADIVRDSINEEVIEARTDYLDHTYLNLKDRLDKENQEVTAQLAQNKNKLTDIINLRSYGIVGNGTDETSLIQQALNDSVGKTIFIPLPETHYLTRQIIIPSNITIRFAHGVKWKATDDLDITNPTFESLFRFEESENVHFYGNDSLFYMDKTAYTNSGGHNHIFMINGAKNIHIHDVNAQGAGGDGFYISGFLTPINHSEKVYLYNCKTDNNRRQGISIIAVQTFRAINCEFNNTNGTAPQAGVDIEPEPYATVLDDIIFDKCVANGNAGHGFEMAFHNLKELVPNITFRNCYSKGSTSGFTVSSAREGSKGLIRFIDCIAEETAYSPFRLRDKSSKGTKVEYIRCKAINCITTGSNQANSGWGSSFIIQQVDETVTYDLGGVKYLECESIDNRDITLVSKGFGMYSGGDSNFDKIEYQNCSVDNAKIDKFFLHDNCLNVRVELKNELFRTELNIFPRYLSHTYTNSNRTSEQIYRLPEAKEGHIYHFKVEKPYQMSIFPEPSSQILGFSTADGDSVECSVVGSRLSIKGRADGHWEIINLVGAWT